MYPRAIFKNYKQVSSLDFIAQIKIALNVLFFIHGIINQVSIS